MKGEKNPDFDGWSLLSQSGEKLRRKGLTRLLLRLPLSWAFHWFMFGDKFGTRVSRAIFTSFPNATIRLNWYHVHTHSVRSESISFLLWTFTYHPYHFHNQIWNHYDLWIIIFSMEQTHWIGQLKSTQSSELESSPTNQFEVKRRFYYQ